MPTLVSTDPPWPTVLLRHALPDDSWHVDWMLGQDPNGIEALITFRLPGPLNLLKPGRTMQAERIGEHRPAYLKYEGPVSGDRGVVSRLARGWIVNWSEADDAWRLTVRWEADTSGGESLC